MPLGTIYVENYMWISSATSLFAVCECNFCEITKCMCMLQVGGVDPKQLAVYEEFARNVPGFLPSNDLSQPTGFLAQPMKVRFYLFIGIKR